MIKIFPSIEATEENLVLALLILVISFHIPLFTSYFSHDKRPPSKYPAK